MIGPVQKKNARLLHWNFNIVNATQIFISNNDHQVFFHLYASNWCYILSIMNIASWCSNHEPDKWSDLLAIKCMFNNFYLMMWWTGNQMNYNEPFFTTNVTKSYLTLFKEKNNTTVGHVCCGCMASFPRVRSNLWSWAHIIGTLPRVYKPLIRFNSKPGTCFLCFRLSGSVNLWSGTLHTHHWALLGGPVSRTSL